MIRPRTVARDEGMRARAASLDELAGVLRIASVLVEELAEDSLLRSDCNRLRQVAQTLCDNAGEIEMVKDGACMCDPADRLADAPCR